MDTIGILIRCPKDLHASLKELAKKNQRSLQGEIVHALQQHMEVGSLIAVLQGIQENEAHHYKIVRTND